MLDLRALLEAELPDRYQLEGELGSGGMATVFLAFDAALGRKVAIKVLKPELASGTEFARFQREIRVMAQLQHPNILPIHDAGSVGDLLYYVAAYVLGESVQQQLSRMGRFSIEKAVSVACEVAEGLDYAHGQGVVHRDVKPANILISNGRALLVDFGIAKAIAGPDSADLTAIDSLVGTARYMSPEHIAGRDKIDGRADIYSLGCVLYEMLAGRPPFVSVSSAQTLRLHLIQKPESLSRWAENLPPALDRIVLRALEKAPERRYSSAGGLRDALSSSIQVAPRRFLGRSIRLRTMLGIAAILAVAIAAVVAAYLQLIR